MYMPRYAIRDSDDKIGGHLQEDVILKVTSTAICGSDLHLYLNSMPGMKAGDILGHEVCFLTVLASSVMFAHSIDLVPCSNHWNLHNGTSIVNI